jgi:hypothetical protein
MSGLMPYVVEKGPYFSALESMIADPARRVHALGEVKNGTDLALLCGFDPPNFAGPIPQGDGRTYDNRYWHFEYDWLGIGAPYFWSNWEGGKPEAILREGMQRALEMSMGLEYNEEPPAAPNRPKRLWPIDFYWICQGPFFQCWVLWRRVSGDLGHVTVLFTTPPAKGYPLNSQITRPSPPAVPGGAWDISAAPNGLNARPDYACAPETQKFGPQPPPRRTSLPEGMWVIGHDNYESHVVSSTLPSGSGNITLPQLVWTAQDQGVVCVQPAEWEGGVLDVPRPYVPGVIPSPAPGPAPPWPVTP